MPQAKPDIGSTANSYAILAKLATGGMAEIFLARTESAAGVERYVVLKRVLQHRATDIKFVNMFLDEARLAAQLQHPNIAQVYDTGKLGDSYFFTMEYVHGETVRELLHRAYAVGQPIPIGCALAIAVGVASGLQHAHERVSLDGKPLGIVHRDVSPSNLMISYDGNIKVVDFGVAKAAHRSIETQSGTVKGKIGYMSPEQCRGGIVDLRCDLFCLGIVMWELLVGERLFKRATDFESMEAIVGAESPPPSSRRADIPAELDAIVLKLLEKAPEDRFQTADELLEAIEKVAVHNGIAISVAGLRRFIRELFGQRPEPWVEMRIREANPEVVTVTGAPLIVGKVEPAAAPIEQQLENLLDLSAQSVIPTVVLPRAPTAPTVSEVVHRETPSEQLRKPSSRYEKPETQPTDSHVESTRVSPQLPTASAIATNPRSIRAWWVVAGFVAIVAAGGAVVYATRGPTAKRADQPQPPSTPIALASPDAMVVEPPVDAAPIAIAPPTVDAGVPAKPATGSATRPRPQVESKQDELTAAFRAERYADTVAACTANARLAAANAVTCTLAACREHDADKARRWMQKAPAAKHGLVLDACDVFGTPLKQEPQKPPPDPKPPKPKCDESDPMACRK